VEDLRKIKMKKLLFGMDAGVGPSASHGFYGLIKNPGKRCVNLQLYRVGIGLDLPAMIIGSFVSQFQKISFHFHKKLQRYHYPFNSNWLYKESLRIFKIPCFFVKRLK